MSVPDRPRARFSQVNIVVSGMAPSLAFYRLLGIEIEDTPEAWEDQHRVVSSVDQDVTLELDSAVSVPNWASDWSSERTGAVIGFAVESGDDVDAIVAAVGDAGHRVLQEPHDAFFGARYAVVEDPDGNAVGIMGPVDPEKRWMPEPPD